MGVDVSQYIIAKSDQLNADDLMGGKTLTIRITRVAGMNDKEQPIAIYFDGDEGKPYKPGKSMRRVLVNFWGKDGGEYVGRWLVLYRDPEVTFGKIKVGGIRIAAMSHIDDDDEMALAVTKGAKRLFKVRAFRPPQEQTGGGNGNGNGNGNGGGQRRKRTPAEQVDAYEAAIGKVGKLDDGSDDRENGLTALAEYQADEARKKWRDGIKDSDPSLFDRIVAAEQARFRELSVEDEDVDGDGAQGEDGGDPVDDDDDLFPGGDS